MAVVKLEKLFFGRRIDHRNGSDAMMTDRNVPLRGIADSTKRESAPPALVPTPLRRVAQFADSRIGTVRSFARNWGKSNNAFAQGICSRTAVCKDQHAY
jgi:hypothetical protein